MSIDKRRYADSYVPNFGTPYIPPLPVEQLNSMSDRELFEYHNARKTMDQLIEMNPVGAGWILPSWKRVMETWVQWPIHVILGGNRSTKSNFAARLMVWGLGNIPEMEARAYHVTDRRSKEDQQRVIYDSLPHGLRNLAVKKGQFHSLLYTQKNGFTDNVCIVPPLPDWRRGGRIDFGNYSQFANDAQVAEGFKAQIIWADEECPDKLFETLQFRTKDYHGRIILTFTTLDGWTPLVSRLLGHTKTLDSVYVPFVGKRLPVLEESLSCPGALIHYWHTENNPFIDTKEFMKGLKGRPMQQILARAYGIPTKAAEAVFASFDKMINVVKHEDLPFVKDPSYPVTRYMAIDPAGSKAWFMTWVAIDSSGTWWVYREWPDLSYEPWALPGPTADGKAGPGQKAGDDKGIRDYVELMLDLEGGEKIFERIIDPRLGAAQRQSEEGATTIISDLDKQDITVIPAPGVDIENGLQLLKGLLSWKPEKPRDALNSPKLFVSDRCQNTIHALAEYTNHSQHEACKDAIDTLRYIAVSNAQHYTSGDLRGGRNTEDDLG
jgi:hypothetical protein